MKSMRFVIATTALAAISTAFAGDPVHHPEAVKNKQADKPAVKAPEEQIGRMDMQMRAMREMHEKIVNAKTPEERQALMAEHMKAMHSGMSMMSGMMGHAEHGGRHAAPPQAMQSRMDYMQKQIDMMQAMMQLMMDRMAPPSPDP